MRFWTPQRTLLVGYIGVILVGTLLLSLPIASTNGRMPLIDSLFTATSAICVTGLTVRNVAYDLTLFGKIVLLFLIQIGGLGYMTMASFLFAILGKKLPLAQTEAISEALSRRYWGGMSRFVSRIVYFTLISEFAGMLALTYAFKTHGYNLMTALGYGLFHAVSAFCNAGFSLFTHSFMPFSNDLVILLTISSLFIIGGMGFIFWEGVVQFWRGGRLHLHGKVVLFTTLLLICGGTGLFYLFEYNYILLGKAEWQKWMLAFFQMTTPRTAGFTALPINMLRNCTVFLVILLMFIGASPGGTGGGIKTTTFFLLIVATWRFLKGERDVVVMHKTIAKDTFERAFYLVVLAMSVIIVGTLVLSVTQSLPFLPTLFEEFSAFGTVGLSYGSFSRAGCSLSYEFDIIGKLVIILTMFIGRAGLLTIGYALLGRRPSVTISYPVERVEVG